MVDINKRTLKYISYLQNKEESSLVIQSLVMSIDLHRNGKTSFVFYTNLIKMLNYYNIPFNFNRDNLDDTNILHFVDHMQKNILPTGNIPFAIHKSLNFIMFLKTAIHYQSILMLLEKILIEKHL